jgi:hypothetical protein
VGIFLDRSRSRHAKLDLESKLLICQVRSKVESGHLKLVVNESGNTPCEI